MNDLKQPAGDEPIKTDVTAIRAITSAELDQAITTARAYPRSLRAFAVECLNMATLNERVAGECIYALPRAGKTIEGPSVRMAEIVASAWGNCRAGARVIEEGAEFVTAQGVFHDLERNVSITYEVRRRITKKDGTRYDADMIGVAANAACSIALRNAIFKGVPKAFWINTYEAARKVVAGDSKTLATRRADALATLAKVGATEPMVLAALGLKGVEDIGVEELVTLRGLYTAVREGEIPVERAFAPKVVEPVEPEPKAKRSRTEKAKDVLDPKPAADLPTSHPDAVPPEGT